MHSVLYKTQIYNYLTAKNICSKASLKKLMTIRQNAQNKTKRQVAHMRNV